MRTQHPQTRALQTLVFQGFMPMPVAAAVCMRRLAPQVFDDPAATLAIVFGVEAITWTPHLPEGDALTDLFAEAAIKSADPKSPQVICQTAGSRMLLPLDVVDVRDARIRLEAATTLKLAPPAERIEAYPLELLQRELRKRERQAARAAEREAEREAERAAREPQDPQP
jgi:hypothetical protein